MITAAAVHPIDPPEKVVFFGSTKGISFLCARKMSPISIDSPWKSKAVIRNPVNGLPNGDEYLNLTGAIRWMKI